MTHILLDIKYKNTETVLYDKNRGESIIKNWCESNNHSLVMPPVSHVFPTYDQYKSEIEGFYNSSLTNRDHEYQLYNGDSSETSQNESKNYNGYTSFGLLKESHISMHTYPEYNCIQIDFFSCKDLDKRQNIEYVERVFKKSSAIKFELQFIKREVV
jgi:S-adenosylmethionine/arginine decarboxylase-like enzyme